MTRRRPLTWFRALDAFLDALAARRVPRRVRDAVVFEVVFLMDDLTRLRAPPEPGDVTARQLRRYLARVREGKASRPRERRFDDEALALVVARLELFFEFLAAERLIEESPVTPTTKSGARRRRKESP